MVKSSCKLAIFSVIFIDIDFFKQFNDLYGHIEGDKCLKTVTPKISQYITKKDFSARVGEEEFIIVITNKILEKTLLVAEYLRTSIQALKIDLRTSITSFY